MDIDVSELFCELSEQFDFSVDVQIGRGGLIFVQSPHMDVFERVNQYLAANYQYNYITSIVTDGRYEAILSAHECDTCKEMVAHLVRAGHTLLSADSTRNDNSAGVVAYVPVTAWPYFEKHDDLSKLFGSGSPFATKCS